MIRRLRALLPAALLLAVALPAAAGGVQLRAPDDIADLLQPYLPDDAGSPRKLQSLLGEILATEGYFSPEFRFDENDDGLQLPLDPGPRTQIAAVDLAIDGPLDPARRAALIAGWRLPVGQPFRQDDWNAAKQDILSRLLADEYPDARLDDSEAAIDASTQQATLRLRYASGPRYRYGGLRVVGLDRYPPELVARYNRSIRPDKPYREEDLAALQGALVATPYFASVQTTLDRDAATADGDERVAPIVVRVREKPAHRVAFGAGASSNTGARVEFNYQTPNLARQAWELDSGLRFEQKRQIAYADVFLPPDDRRRRHSIGVMAEATDIQGLKTERYAFGAQTVQQRGSVEQRLSLHWEDERREPSGAAAVTSRALVPNAMWTWRRIDNPLDPRDGTVLQGQVGGGAKAALSDQNFVRLHARFQHYLSFGRHDTLALRGEVGYTLADSRLRIPQDYLFRTGGTGSVRGYAYQSLGIKEGTATVGGRYLATASAEWTHWLDSEWGIATFIDAGDAVDQLKNINLAVGVGLGARWRSPAGPIGIDLAYGERNREVHLHFSLAIPF